GPGGGPCADRAGGSPRRRPSSTPRYGTDEPENQGVKDAGDAFVALDSAVVLTRFGRQVGVRRLTLPASEFGPPDADLPGGVEGEPHPVPSDLDHGQGDVADDDLLAGLPAQSQHVQPP